MVSKAWYIRNWMLHKLLTSKDLAVINELLFVYSWKMLLFKFCNSFYFIIKEKLSLINHLNTLPKIGISFISKEPYFTLLGNGIWTLFSGLHINKVVISYSNLELQNFYFNFTSLLLHWKFSFLIAYISIFILNNNIGTKEVDFFPVLFALGDITLRVSKLLCFKDNWFQIRKGICEDCILSPCLFNLYAEYIMWNAGLEEAQAGIKIAGRNINNLRYADDTTLMAESKEELRASWWKWKSKKVGLKLNIQKTKIIAFGPITSWQIDGEAMKTVTDFILGGSKISADGDCNHKIKRSLLLGGKAMTNLDSILKSKDITNKGPSL